MYRVMLRKIETPAYEAFLVRHRMPSIRFHPDRRLDASIVSVWTALAAEAWDSARRIAIDALDEPRMFATDERAGLLAGLAVADLMSGRTDDALVSATRSLELFPRQWLSRRVSIEVGSLRRDYRTCYRELAELDRPEVVAAWDEALDDLDIELGMASFSWKLGKWERVATHLSQAFPEGLVAMPDFLREDWFRLSLYRSLPEEAARAASSLIDERSVERMDELLQTIVQSGWTAQALPLYRNIHQIRPTHELVRRRLVALCIKEGELEEARRIVATSALRLAA